jgi:citronellol/citronellal dehydrogenase
MPSEIFAPGLLADQVVVVSGGGTGLGRATACELASCGASVVVCGRRPEPLERTVELCENGLCEAIPCDIREPEQVDALCSAVLERYGKIDTLVNNAGGQFMAPAEDISANGFRAVIRLNLEGTWLMTQTFATRAMIPAGGGKVITVTLSPHNGLPGMAHSSAARAACENMTRVLATEWARFNIRMTAIAAGHMDTEALAGYPEQVVAGVADTIPVGRLGRPQEHAWLVSYLASRAGDYMSGAVLTLDGGRDNWLGSWPPAETSP